MPPLRRQAVRALAEHGTMALAMLDKYAADPDFREILRAPRRRSHPADRPDRRRSRDARLPRRQEQALVHRIARPGGPVRLGRQRPGDDPHDQERRPGTRRPARSDRRCSIYQFLPLYDVIHLGNVLRRGYAPTTGEMTWALVDGCFVITDVLSLVALQPEGVVAAEAVRSEVKAAVREGAKTLSRDLVAAAANRPARLWSRHEAGIGSRQGASQARFDRLKAAWHGGGPSDPPAGSSRCSNACPEALPRLSLAQLTEMAGPLAAKAGLRLSSWRPVRLLKDGAEVVLRIPPQRGLKYVAAQAVQAGVGVVGYPQDGRVSQEPPTGFDARTLDDNPPGPLSVILTAPRACFVGFRSAKARLPRHHRQQSARCREFSYARLANKRPSPIPYCVGEQLQHDYRRFASTRNSWAESGIGGMTMMWKGLIPTFVLVVLLSPPARAQRIPVSFQTGWETVITRLGPVAAESEAGREAPNEHMAVIFAYDQYWLIIPIWTRAQGFGGCEDFEYPQKPKEIWIFEEQNTAKISADFGVPEDELERPLSYFVPQGWALIAVIAVLAKFMGGPGPQKRFSRLWGDPRYRRAIAKLLDHDWREFPEVFDQITLDETPPDPAHRFDDVVRWLVEQGIGRRKASRELDFLSRYLVDNNKIALLPPKGALIPSTISTRKGPPAIELGDRSSSLRRQASEPSLRWMQDCPVSSERGVRCHAYLAPFAEECNVEVLHHSCMPQEPYSVSRVSKADNSVPSKPLISVGGELKFDLCEAVRDCPATNHRGFVLWRIRQIHTEA